MTKSRSRVKKGTPPGAAANSDVPHSIGQCAVCETGVHVNVLTCKTCQADYHPVCAGIDDDVFEVLQPILPTVGWVCVDCIASISEKRKTIDNNIQSLYNAIHKLENDHHALQNRVAAVETNCIPMKPPGIMSNTSSISQVVNDTVKDQLRRKKNIIVSGLPESNDVSDASVLREICEVHLQFKPWFDESKCRRIGSSNPRRLLVSLASEQAASELLYAARKNMKNVCNDDAASKIFFNPDLSPEDAHKAYLKRQERRSKRSGQTHDTATAADISNLDAQASTSTSSSTFPNNN